jgi:hypothetical protein
MTTIDPAKPPPPHSGAIAHDQRRNARDGVECSGRSDQGQRLPHERLPHERDESPDTRADGEREATPGRPVMEQAAADVERGLQDTEARGIPSDPPSSAENRQRDELRRADSSPSRSRA